MDNKVTLIGVLDQEIKDLEAGIKVRQEKRKQLLEGYFSDLNLTFRKAYIVYNTVYSYPATYIVGVKRGIICYFNVKGKLTAEIYNEIKEYNQAANKVGVLRRLRGIPNLEFNRVNYLYFTPEFLKELYLHIRIEYVEQAQSKTILSPLDNFPLVHTLSFKIGS
jgi:hypothetical protein